MILHLGLLFRLELKKNFNLKTLRGVCTYLFVVTGLTVDSCIPTSAATSRKTSGFMCRNTVFQKVALERIDNTFCHSVNRALTLVNTFDEPRSRFEAILQYSLS